MNPKKRHCNIVQVTPEMAKKWLEQNISNRPLRPNLIKLYGDAILNGEWLLTAEPVCFCNPYTDPATKEKHGETLMEGQHRLAAIVQTGRTIPMTVWWGCDFGEFNVLGQGRRRTIADILYLTDKTIKSPLGVSKATMAFIKHGLGYHESCEIWLVRRVLKHVGREAAAVAGYQKKLGRMMNREMGGAFMLSQMIQPRTTAEMVEKLSTGIGMSKDDPVRMIFRYMQDQLTGIEARDTLETRFYKVCNGVAHVLQKQETDRLKQTPIGIAWLRTECRSRLDPIIAELPGILKENIYDPRISNRRRGMLREKGMLRLAAGKNI